MIKELLWEHRNKLAAGACVVTVAIGSYALGRYVVPEKVLIQERVKVVEVEKQVVVVQEKVVEKVVRDEAKKERVRREERTVKRPDGSEETTKTEEIGIDTVVRDTKIEYVDRVVEKEVVKYVDREVEKRVEITRPLPDWRLSAMAGVNGTKLPGLLAGDSFDAMTHLSFGASLERRIWGPVHAGVWGLSTGQGGLSLSLDF